MNPFEVLVSLEEAEGRLTLAAIVVLGLLLAGAHAVAPGPMQTNLAVLLLFAAPLVSLRLSGQGAKWFLLVAAIGGRLAFHPADAAEASWPVILLDRLAYFVVPPLVVNLLLNESDRARLKIEPVHVYAPTAVIALGTLVHLIVRRGVDLETGEREIRWAAVAWGAGYLGVLLAGLISRVGARDKKPAPVVTDRALEFEEQGRFGVASRLYEREGELEKSAHAAERAGEWGRAGSLYRRTGDSFMAGEMYFRAQMLMEALACYEQAGALPAAARLCMQLGQVDRAVALYEKAGDMPSALRALEQAGTRPAGEQYLRAGMAPEAVTAFETSGEWFRAAEVCEHNLQDPGRAVDLYKRAGSMRHAGQLLESMGRTEEALETYAAQPACAVDAARLSLKAGRPQQAAELLSHLPAPELDKLEDEETLVTLARVMVATGRDDEAIRLLQGLKRRGPVGGAVHLLLGHALLHKGHQELAEESLRTAVSLPLEAGDEINAAYTLGCALEASGQRDEAVRIFHEILQKDLHYADAEDRYRKLKSSAVKDPSPS